MNANSIDNRNQDERIQRLRQEDNKSNEVKKINVREEQKEITTRQNALKLDIKQQTNSQERQANEVAQKQLKQGFLDVKI
ncbi:MAG: hypothetical protein ACOVNU_08290 [Candidatus Kapaibacteriota bacterium]|jgi:hypothetical protein